MSLRVLTLVWDRFPEGGSKLLTMLALADWAGDDGGRIYPSIPTLAAKIRLSERQAMRVLQELASDLWITNLTPDNLGGRGQKSRFKINIETLTNCHPLYRKRVTNPSETLTPATLNPDTKTPESKELSQIPRQPLKNRYIEPGAESAKPVDKSLSWGPPGEDKIKTLQSYLAQLRRVKYADKKEIERAEKELADLLAGADKVQPSLPL